MSRHMKKISLLLTIVLILSMLTSVISYSVSAIASIQICRKDTESDKGGPIAFEKLLNSNKCRTFGKILKEAGLDNPFEKNTIKETAEFFKKELELD